MDKPRIEKILSRVRKVLECSDPEASEVKTIEDLDRVSYDLSRKIGKVVTDELKGELTDERAAMVAAPTSTHTRKTTLLTNSIR
jgi:hypothetical protein